METFNEESKLWIYQTERSLTPEEIHEISPLLATFCKNWTAHNSQLKADYSIVNGRFILLTVDETMNLASGCSIDKSVAFMKTLAVHLNMNLFERMQMTYQGVNGIQDIHFNDVKTAYQAGQITDETLFYDRNVQTLGAYKKAFLIPLKQHWLYQSIK